MIFEPRSLEKHEKIEFLVSLTISFMKILIFFLNSDFLPLPDTFEGGDVKALPEEMQQYRKGIVISLL